MAAAQLLLRQPLIFCCRDLLRSLVKRAPLLLEGVETARSLAKQLDSAHRFLICATQVVGLCRTNDKDIKVSKVLRLGGQTTLLASLNRMGVPLALRKGARNVNRLYHLLVACEFDNEIPPEASILDIVYDWYSYMSAIVADVTQKEGHHE